MDSLKDLQSVKSALAQFSVGLVKLGHIIESIEENKRKIESAWKSDNATDFTVKYSTLINSLIEARNNLNNYQKKIENVIKEFEGFDQSIVSE